MNKKIFAIDIRLIGKKRTGDETVFFHLTKELIRLDSENEYHLLTDEMNEDVLADITERLDIAHNSNVKIVSLRARNRFIWNLLTVPKYLFQNTIDVFHTQYIVPFFVPRRTKLVTHIHDVSFCAYPDMIGKGDRFFLAILIPYALRRADTIITPSQFTKDEIVKYYNVSEEKIVVIYNGIGEEFTKPHIFSSENGVLLKEKYRLPEHFILSVGTLQPRKNLPFLIEAFALLKKRLPEIKLVIVGNRKAHHIDPRIDQTILTYNLTSDVIFPGFIDAEDLPNFISMTHVFVFPSLYEGFGIPLLEAMSQTVPVCASDIPSLREIGGEAVLYFDPTKLASCEESLYNLCTNEALRESIKEAGRERMKLFSWEKSAVLLLEEYKK